MKKIIFLLGALFIGSVAHAQINVPTQPSVAIVGENAFLDASSYTGSFPNNQAKGLYFPKTDLTTWEFKTSSVTPGKFKTYFDGMIVYNSGTGNTIADATKGGKQVAVSPGFYYFKNPNQSAPRGSVTNGEWVRLGADFTSTARALSSADICQQSNAGAFHYKEVEVDGAKRGRMGFCTVQNGTYTWVYFANGANIIQTAGSNKFGEGL